MNSYNPKCPEWLNSAVFYQIYPQSFFDSNGDGIGDISGIIRKLDYIQSLGCNAIWINPCFVSPFRDAGYDIADYYRVAPRYGTNTDLQSLFTEAKKGGSGFAFILTMPGIPFIYYGDEIGIKYQPDLVSKEGGYDRTGSRTPMQWDSSINAGFSTAQKEDLYLPLDPDPDRPTVESQNSNRHSLLNKIRRLISLRKENPALLAAGSFRPLFARSKQYPFCYLRTSSDQKILICLNPAQDCVDANFTLPGWTTAGKWLVNEGVHIKKETGEFAVSVVTEGLSYGIYCWS